MPAIITGRFQSGDGYDGIAVTNFYNEIYPVATSGWRIRDKLKFLGYSTSSYYVNSKFLTVGAVNYGTDGGVYCDIAGSNLNGINIYGGSNLNFYAWFELKSSLVPVSSTGGYYDIDVQTGSYSKSVGWELSSNVLTYYQSNQMKIIIKAVAYSNYRFIRWVYANRNMKDNTDNCWTRALFAPYSSTTYTFKSSSNGRVTFSYRKIEYGVGVGKYKNGIDSSTSSVKWTYSYTTENGISNYTSSYMAASANFNDDDVNDEWNNMIDKCNYKGIPSSLLSAAKNNVFSGYNSSGAINHWTSISTVGFVTDVGYFYGTLYYEGSVLHYQIQKPQWQRIWHIWQK